MGCVTSSKELAWVWHGSCGTERHSSLLRPGQSQRRIGAATESSTTSIVGLSGSTPAQTRIPDGSAFLVPNPGHACSRALPSGFNRPKFPRTDFWLALSWIGTDNFRIRRDSGVMCLSDQLHLAESVTCSSPRRTTRALQDSVADQRGRHGRGLQGPRHQARPRHGHQSSVCGVGQRPTASHASNARPRFWRS